MKTEFLSLVRGFAKINKQQKTDKSSKDTDTSKPERPQIPLDVAESFNTLVSAWKECTIIAEQEKTKRVAIRANRDVNVKAIEEQSAILKQYLEHVFVERAGVIQGMFKTLDSGLASGNTELISQSIGAIVSITKQSPLVGAKELIAGYHDPNVKSIEI